MTAALAGGSVVTTRVIGPHGTEIVGAQQIRVFVVDGHRVFAEALVDLLDRLPGLTVIGAAFDAASAAARLAGVSVDVVLVDPATVSGLSLSDLRSWAGDASIAVVSEDGTDTRTVAQHGVRGWFGKDQVISTLVDALPGLGAGCAYFPAARLGAELDVLTERIRDLETGIGIFATLTPREREVLSMLLKGRARPAIARALHLSEGTVRSHIEHLMGKLGAHSTIAAVALARRYGWESLLNYPQETYGSAGM